MRLLTILHFATIVLLLLSTGVGGYQILENYLRYGESYQVTTTIEGASSTETVTLEGQLAGLMFVLWITLLLTVLLFTQNMTNRKEATEPRVKA
jgi:small-conductance mechanosensitive channel